MRSLSSASVALALGASVVVVLSSAVGDAQAPAPTFRLATFDANGDPRLGATVGNGEHDLLDVHNGIRYLMQTGAPEAQNLPYIPADMRTLAGAGPRATTAIRQVYAALAAQKAKGTLKDPGRCVPCLPSDHRGEVPGPGHQSLEDLRLRRQLPARGQPRQPEVPQLVLQVGGLARRAGRHHRPGRPGDPRRARAGTVTGDQPARQEHQRGAGLRLRLRLHGLQRRVVARPRPGRAPDAGRHLRQGARHLLAVRALPDAEGGREVSAEPGDSATIDGKPAPMPN